MRILLLPVLLCIAASTAAAVTLDLDNPYGIAALYVVADSGIAHGMNYVVCTNGNGYAVPNHESGAWWTFVPSPVPLAEVVDWTPWTLYTTDGRWFVRSSSPDVWEQMGVDTGIPPPPCFAPVGASGQSLGDVKSLFR